MKDLGCFMHYTLCVGELLSKQPICTRGILQFRFHQHNHVKLKYIRSVFFAVLSEQ